MKKTLLTFITIVLTICYTQAQTRLVLFEEFTGENCPPCASINPNIWTLFQSGTNPDHIFMIKYMVDIPSAGPFYNANHTYADPRKSYYGCSFAPYCRMDGIVKWTSQPYPGFPTYLVQGDIDSNAGVPPSFTITAHRQYQGDSVFVSVTVNCLSAVSGTMKLHVAFVRSMMFASAPGTNGEKDFENVVRNMYPNENGTAMASSWTVGQTQTYNIRGKRFQETLSGVTIPDSNIVVWIQDNNNKTVKQAAIATSATGIPTVASKIDNVSIFPNPAKNNIIVTANINTAASVRMSIINAIGQTVWVGQPQMLKGELNQNIQLNDLGSGLYFVCISAGGETVTQKFTVVK